MNRNRYADICLDCHQAIAPGGGWYHGYQVHERTWRTAAGIERRTYVTDEVVCDPCQARRDHAQDLVTYTAEMEY